MTQGKKIGAINSLNKTISEIVDFLEGKEVESSQNGGLRSHLHEKIGDLAALWFRKGFRRGHRQSYSAFQNENQVPLNLEYECIRKLSPNQERDLILKSKIKDKKKLKKNIKKKSKK